MKARLKRFVKRLLSRRRPHPRPAETAGGFSTEAVAGYYDDFTGAYLRATGDFIQAYRTGDTDALMSYLVSGMGLRDGMRVLDAGCGVGAPALWIAQHYPKTTITCVTNSAAQYVLAVEKIRAAGVEARVTVLHGDYHDLPGLCSSAAFDRVVFLESLGHHHDLDRVLSGVRHVLAPGGAVYIKDFFQRASKNAEQQRLIDEAVGMVNHNYLYNVMRLPRLIQGLIDNDLGLNFVKAPTLATDLSLTVAFEHEAGRLTYPVFSKVHALDWFEVLAARQ